MGQRQNLPDETACESGGQPMAEHSAQLSDMVQTQPLLFPEQDA